MAEVELEHLDVRREAAEHRIPPSVRREEHLTRAELGLRTEVDTRTECGRKELRAETDAEVRDAGEHGLADRALLVDEPRELLFLPHAHRTAHHEEEVVVAPVGERLALLQPDGVDVDAPLLEDVAEDADRVGAQMLECQRSHAVTSASSRARSSRARKAPTRCSLRSYST